MVALHRWRDNPASVKVKANQSAQKDFEGSDLIVADGQTVTYGSPPPMNSRKGPNLEKDM